MGIQRIQQTGRRDVVFSLFGPGRRERLVLSLETPSPFFGFTSEKAESSPPTGFVLGLRKRLEGGRLISISQEGLDRVLYLHFSGRDSLGNRVPYVLIFDAAGKGRNIGLFRDDALEMAVIHPDETRFALGMPYSPPEGRPLDLAKAPESEIQAWSKRFLASQETPSLSAFLSLVEGFGKEAALGMLHGALQHPGLPFSAEGAVEVCSALEKVAGFVRKQEDRNLEHEPCFHPAVYQSRKDASPIFHVLPLPHLIEVTGFASPLEGASMWRQIVVEHQRLARIRSFAESLHLKLLHKIVSRRDAMARDLASSGDPEKYRLWAELIDSSGKRRPPGESEISVMDYYKDPPSTVIVPLDPRYSSRDNARNYYRVYGKSTRAKKVLESNLRREESYLSRLRKARGLLDEAGTVEDYEEILQELGAMAKKEGLAIKSSVARPKPSQPKATGVLVQSIPGPDGATFFVGGSARANDHLITVVRRPGDVWFHAKSQKGAHVLARPSSDSASVLTDGAMLAAAKLAAQRSAARGASKVEVDYVDASRVRKPRGGAPGFVTYTGQSTLVVPLP